MSSNDTRIEMGAQPSPRKSPVSGVTLRRTAKYTDDPVSLGLRKLWQNVEKEPVPIEFLDLLDAIDAMQTDATQGGASLSDPTQAPGGNLGEGKVKP